MAATHLPTRLFFLQPACGTLPAPRNPVVAAGKKLTQANRVHLGMDCRGDHHGGNVRRRRGYVCGVTSVHRRREDHRFDQEVTAGCDQTEPATGFGGKSESKQ